MDVCINTLQYHDELLYIKINEITNETLNAKNKICKLFKVTRRIYWVHWHFVLYNALITKDKFHDDTKYVVFPKLKNKMNFYSSMDVHLNALKKHDNFQGDMSSSLHK